MMSPKSLRVGSSSSAFEILSSILSSMPIFDIPFSGYKVQSKGSTITLFGWTNYHHRTWTVWTTNNNSRLLQLGWQSSYLLVKTKFNITSIMLQIIIFNPTSQDVVSKQAIWDDHSNVSQFINKLMHKIYSSQLQLPRPEQLLN